MLVFDVAKMKVRIESLGIKQKAISEKSGISEVALSLILQGKRKCEIGEYASICEVLGVNIGEFLKPRMPSEYEPKELV